MTNLEENASPSDKTHTDSELSVLIDLTVDDGIFDKVASVGQREVTQHDYFTIGVRHILSDKFKKDEPVAETE